VVQELLAGFFSEANRARPSRPTPLRTDLVLATLDMAVAQRRPRDVIHPSDQGCQYTSLAFWHRCREAGVRPSMGSVGDAYDTAMRESFFGDARVRVARSGMLPHSG